MLFGLYRTNNPPTCSLYSFVYTFSCPKCRHTVTVQNLCLLCCVSLFPVPLYRCCSCMLIKCICLFPCVHSCALFDLRNVDAEMVIMCSGMCVCLCLLFHSALLHSGAFQHPLPESSCVTSFKHTPEFQLHTQPFMLLAGSAQEGSQREERRAITWERASKTRAVFFYIHILG